MFDREKQIVINRYCKAIFNETEKISVSDILNLKIPEPIKHYIRLELQKKVEEEFLEIKKFSQFNYDHIRIKPFVDELKVLLSLTKELDIKEFSILLKFALDLNLDYLLKPCDTLTSFILRYEEFQTISIVNDRLNYIVEYDYFPILVKKYFEKKSLNKISKDDFLSLLYKIEKEYTRDFTILDHYGLFIRFKEFLHELNLSITDVAEYEAFIIYLKDKQQNDLASFLEQHRERFKAFDGNVTSYLQSILHSSIVERKAVDQRFETKEEIFEIKSSIKEEAFDEKVTEEKLTESPMEEGLKDFDDGRGIKSEQASTEADETYSGLQDVLVKEKIETSEQRVIQKTYDRNLDGLMPNRMRKKVISKIFGKDEFEFMNFMQKLNSVNNWDEASFLLTDLFDKKNIQPFSKWAIKFTEFLYENIK
jgi:predicted transcriptional regulator